MTIDSGRCTDAIRQNGSSCGLRVITNVRNSRCTVGHNVVCMDSLHMAVTKGCSSALFDCGSAIIHCRAAKGSSCTVCDCSRQRFEQLEELYTHFGDWTRSGQIAPTLADYLRQHPSTRNATAQKINMIAQRAACTLRLGTYETFALLPRLLAHARRGGPKTFIEIGAYDGVDGSQTHALEACLGWTGLLVEANPSNFAKLERSPRSARKVHAAACAEGRTVRMSTAGETVAVVVDEMSRYYQGRFSHILRLNQTSSEQAGMVNVSCRELGILARESGLARIGFASIDTQGTEDTVLSTIDAGLLDVVLVEEDKTNKGKNSRVRERLEDGGLRPAPLDLVDGWGRKGVASKAKAAPQNILFMREAAAADLSYSALPLRHLRRVADALALHHGFSFADRHGGRSQARPSSST